MLWIFQVCALAAGLFGQVWATSTLIHPSFAKARLIFTMSSLLSLQGVKIGTGAHCLLRETGQLPLDFIVFAVLSVLARTLGL